MITHEKFIHFTKSQQQEEQFPNLMDRGIRLAVKNCHFYVLYFLELYQNRLHYNNHIFIAE